MAQVGTMVRTALIVSNLERSTAFYREVLGIAGTYAEGELTHPAGAQLLGMPAGAKVRYRIIKQAGGPNRGMVGLFEVTNPAPPTFQKRRDRVNIGEAVLVFYCDDVNEVHRKLVAGGHTVVCPPTHLQVTATKGQPEMVFMDPDGVLVNLIQRDPDDPK
ncbi:MAG: VOC family protein [Rhodospirillaceae bacterium]|nr:VOC family protein [Rhodospirillaceae bacterium]